MEDRKQKGGAVLSSLFTYKISLPIRNPFIVLCFSGNLVQKSLCVYCRLGMLGLWDVLFIYKTVIRSLSFMKCNLNLVLLIMKYLHSLVFFFLDDLISYLMRLNAILRTV